MKNKKEKIVVELYDNEESYAKILIDKDDFSVMKSSLVEYKKECLINNTGIEIGEFLNLLSKRIDLREVSPTEYVYF